MATLIAVELTLPFDHTVKLLCFHTRTKQPYSLPIYRRVGVYREPGTTRQTSQSSLPFATLPFGSIITTRAIGLCFSPNYASSLSPTLPNRSYDLAAVMVELAWMDHLRWCGLVGLAALHQLPDAIFHPKVRNPNVPIFQLSKS